MKSMRKRLNVVLPKNAKIRSGYTAKKLRSCFKIKDKIKFHHEHGLIEHFKCLEDLCSNDYINEPGSQVIKRVKDHNVKDRSFHMLKYSVEKNHTEVTMNNFKLIGRKYRNNLRKRKVAEALLKKQFSPFVNVQKQSVVLKFLNYLSR